MRLAETRTSLVHSVTSVQPARRARSTQASTRARPAPWPRAAGVTRRIRSTATCGSGPGTQSTQPTRTPSSSATQPARRGSGSAFAKSATIRATSASNVVSQPIVSAYTSPCFWTIQPRSPGLSADRTTTPMPEPPTETVVSVRLARVTVRREELLEKAYGFVLEHGLADLSLRPLAQAVGSSPRVLLYLFGSKDGLVRELLARARRDELAAIQGIGGGDLEAVTERLWQWLSAPELRPLLVLWVEA